MRIKFKQKKAIKQRDLENATIKYFRIKDQRFHYISNPKIKKGITRPDLLISSKDKAYVIELKSHSPTLSDISMVKQASIEFEHNKIRFIEPFIIYPSGKTRNDVVKFAEVSGVKLISINNIDKFDEQMNYYI
ncbi:hypothetical protein ES703_109425 [subsurface metagenome]